MTSFDVDLDARVRARIASATRRREALAAFHEAHLERRQYGNARRHAQKLARAQQALDTAAEAAAQEKS